MNQTRCAYIYIYMCVCVCVKTDVYIHTTMASPVSVSWWHLCSHDVGFRQMNRMV